MAFLPENLPPLNKDPNESSEDESPMDNPHHFRKGIMDHAFDCSDSQRIIRFKRVLHV